MKLSAKELFNRFKDKHFYQIRFIFSGLSLADRSLILQEIPSFIKETLNDCDYTLLKKIIDTFFDCHFKNSVLEHSDIQLLSEFPGMFGVQPRLRSGYPREKIILDLTLSRPNSGIDQAALIVLSKHIMNLLLSEEGLYIEKITDDYGTDLLNLCIIHFPELFDIIFEKTKYTHPGKVIEGFFRTRREGQDIFFLRDITTSQVYFKPSRNDALYAAIMMSNKDKLHYHGGAFICPKDIIKKIIDHIVENQKGNIDKTKADLTPLMLAAVFGDTETVNYLLNKGANINLKVYEQTALILALRYNRDETVITLLKQGAQFEESDCFSKEAQKLKKIQKEIQKEMQEIAVNIVNSLKKDEHFILPSGYHLVEREVPEDGNCLYHALASNGTTAIDLREAVANYIEDGNLGGFLENATEYAARVRTGLWGGEPEIRALMHILSRPIVVMHQNGLAPIHYTKPGLSGEPLFISYNGINHYNALDPASGYTAREIYAIHLPMILALHQKLPCDLIYSVLSYLNIAEFYSKLNIKHFDSLKSKSFSPFLFKGNSTSNKRKADELEDDDEEVSRKKTDY